MIEKVVVVGAGIGGLAAAARLAHAGIEVVVVEAADEEGGKIGREEWEGVRFDTGPSLLTMPWVFGELFAECGERFEEAVELIRLDPAFEYRWPDGASLTVRAELSATIEAVRASLGARAAAEFASFMEYARSIWEEALPNFVAGPAPELGGVMRLGLGRLARLRRIDPLRTMQAGIERHVREPHLRDLLMRYATYNGSDPRRAPATLNCIAWVEMGEGGWGIAGGMHALPRAVRALAERGGARFEFGERVERVEVEGGARARRAASGGAPDRGRRGRRQRRRRPPRARSARGRRGRARAPRAVDVGLERGPLWRRRSPDRAAHRPLPGRLRRRIRRHLRSRSGAGRPYRLSVRPAPRAPARRLVGAARAVVRHGERAVRARRGGARSRPRGTRSARGCSRARAPPGSSAPRRASSGSGPRPGSRRRSPAAAARSTAGPRTRRPRRSAARRIARACPASTSPRGAPTRAAASRCARSPASRPRSRSSSKGARLRPPRSGVR